MSLGKIVKNAKDNEFTKLLIVLVVFMASVGFFMEQSSAQTPGTPDQPLGFTAVAISPTSASLNWSPPQNNGGAPVTGYEIDYRIVPSTTYTNLATLGNVTSFTHVNLITGKTYLYRVSAINSNGTGTPSPEALVTPTSSSAPPKNIAPNSPQSLTASIYSSTQINLSWNPPISNGGPPVTGYKIDYMLDSANFTNLVSNSGSSFTAYSHTGLQVGHTYSYRVFAINSIGTSNSSNTASATTVQITTVPGSPILSVNPSSATSVSLSWTPPTNDGGSAIIGYKIEFSNGTSQYTVLVANTGNTQTAYLHNGLVTGQTYTYRVTAINSIGTGNPSNIETAQPQETLTPTITMAVPISPTQISLSWIPPSQTYGQVVNGYRIDQVINGALIFVDSAGVTSTTYTVPNLTTGKTYAFAVTALLSGGSETNPSPFVSAMPTSTSSAPTPSGQPASQNSVPQQNQALPDPPTGLNAVMISQNTVKLSWVMPSNNGKLPVTGFKIETKTDTSGIWSLVTSNIGVQTSFVKSGLQAGTTYFYRISSISSIGTGQPSIEVSINPSPNTNQTSIAPSSPVAALQQSQGMIPVINTTSTISYQIIGGQISGASVNPGTFSLNINLKTNTGGIISVQIPRDMMDAKKLDGTDEAYIITDDKNIAKFNETKTSSYRTLVISFPTNTGQISIYGTSVVPEFPIVLVAFVLAFIPVIAFSKIIIKY
ncbi:MAG: fibronectin type III domain-containing protein [Thaumarchaeota archaeon]|nr:fibronectin type III domain-containing protein [Nitrososphaerota archaeon]